jgi:hypothetical protein
MVEIKRQSNGGYQSDSDVTNISGETNGIVGREATMATRTNGESDALSALEFRLGITQTLEALRATNEKFHESQNAMMKMLVESAGRKQSAASVWISAIGVMVVLLGGLFVFYSRVSVLEANLTNNKEEYNRRMSSMEDKIDSLIRINSYNVGKRDREKVEEEQK